MPKDFAIIESITTLPLDYDFNHEIYAAWGDFKLMARVWRNEEDFGPYDNDDLNVAFWGSLTVGFDLDKQIKATAIALASVSRVNAVEVKNDEGYGVVLYPEWP